jgi:hypothetical protein
LIRIATKYKDKNGIPVFVGDLIKVSHFVARNRKKIFMYRKIFIINDLVYAVEVQNLGILPTAECHKCRVEALESFEVIDGESINHPVCDWLVCWWERKRLARELF